MIASAPMIRIAGRKVRSSASKAGEKEISGAALRESVRRWMETEIDVIGGRSHRVSERFDMRTVRTLLDGLPAQAAAAPASRDLDAPYLTSMLRTEVLSPALESRMFEAMNACKRKAVRLQKRLSLTTPRKTVVRDLERWMELAVELRNRIVAANVRLVVSVARKFAGAQCSLTELISDGNLTLLKAVEKFDVTRGFRFSTYATWALRYDFIRSIRRRNSSGIGQPTNEDRLEDLADSREDQVDERRRSDGLQALRRMLTFLDPREHAIIERRFGLTPGSEEHSLQEIASELGICKERVRQLQLRALEKLRASAERFLPDACEP